MTALNKLSQYGSSFQVKVLTSLLKHKEFLQNIYDVLDPEYFDNPAHKWLVEEILRYYHKYHTNATLDSLHIEVKKIDNEILKISVVEQLKEAFKTINEDQDYIEQEFANFCKNQQLKKALLTSVDLLQSGMYDDIRTIIDSALKSGQDKNIGHEYEKDIESRYRKEERGAIPTGWDIIDEMLQGGLGAGDFGIIFGNPGGGKCVGYNTEIEIQYEEYGIQLINNLGEKYIMWILPWDEFNIDGIHLYGWQVYNLIKK
jgi:replicative DNA helicase